MSPNGEVPDRARLKLGAPPAGEHALAVVSVPFGAGGAWQRRIGIVAIACRLLIALWRYVETGVPPEGAMLKA